MKILKLLSSIVICFIAGIIGSLYTSNSVQTWYAYIEKPIFNPPNWLFAPVWTLLYVLIGISLFLVWESKTKNKKKAYIFFAIQLLLNTFWSIIFFGYHNLFFAFIEIIVLWIMILLTIIEFYKISKTTLYLLLPYLLWVSFATILTFSVWQLN